jgi:predicted anti-sigma-YlaC factor YlaD
MLLSCKQVAEKLSENLDQPLTGATWLKVKLHLLLCGLCRLYGKQLEITSDTIKCVESDRKVSAEVRQKVESSYRELHVKKNSSS